MNDTPAAAPTAPASAAPAEAVINPNPVQAPSPISSQAPERQAPDEPRPQSRRETIQRAFERAEKAGRPGPAQAKMGHNQPPEPTEKEKSRPDPIDLKKRPTEQPAPRERGEHGHFAAKPKDEPSEARQQQPGASQPTSQRPAAPSSREDGRERPGARQDGRPGLPDHAPYREPPQPRRWDPQARADWDATPESVRGAVHRMNHEFGRFYQQARADREVMNSIRPFQQMAHQHGTTLQEALTHYVGIENKLRGDPIAGLDQIVNNLNLRTADGQRIGLRDIAYYVLNQSPEQHQLLRSQNQQSAQAYQMGQMFQAYNALAQQVQQMQYDQRYVHTRGAVDRFAESHPRTDELGDAIKQELDFGFDLATAYKRAELLNPATQAAQTRTASAQTRPIDRSISGAPAGPLNGSARRQKASASPREAVMNALKRVNGSV